MSGGCCAGDAAPPRHGATCSSVAAHGAHLFRLPRRACSDRSRTPHEAEGARCGQRQRADVSERTENGDELALGARAPGSCIPSASLRRRRAFACCGFVAAARWSLPAYQVRPSEQERRPPARPLPAPALHALEAARCRVPAAAPALHRAPALTRHLFPPPQAQTRTSFWRNRSATPRWRAGSAATRFGCAASCDGRWRAARLRPTSAQALLAHSARCLTRIAAPVTGGASAEGGGCGDGCGQVGCGCRARTAPLGARGRRRLVCGCSVRG